MLNYVNILSEIKTEAGGLICYYLKKEVYENDIESYKLSDKYPRCGVRYDFHDVRFVFTPSYLCLIYVIFVCLCIVVSGTCCVFLRIVYPTLPVSRDCLFFCPFGILYGLL